MVNLEAVGLGILLATVGVVFVLLTRILLRAVPRLRPTDTSQKPLATLPVQVPANPDAILVIQPGGRVIHTNTRAREWLGINADEQPNLEHLARGAHPRDVFLNLCGGEGQAKFTLQGQYYEGTSYTIPYQSQQVILLTLKRPQLTALTDPQEEGAGESIDLLSDLSRSMTASLDLETTLKAIFETVEQLIPSDFSEITLWDTNRELLVPYRFVNLVGIARELETTNERYSPSSGFSGYLISQRRSLLVEDIETFTQVQPAIDRRRYPIRTYLGIPLVINQDPIGTLELARLTPQPFSQNDQEVLRILSGQASVAIGNALTHRQEQQRVAELSGLATLAQATGSLEDPQDLYERLIQSIGPLTPVEILGLLIYQEAQRSLEGQTPFLGMPDQFVELYKTHIVEGSPAEKIWNQSETIVSTNAPEDERIQALGLAHLAQAAGIRNTMMVPLTAHGRSLGYLQAANKTDGSLLSEDEQRLLTIIAGQVGPILENAYLIQDSRRRARQSEAMRRITSLSASSATLDEILKFSLLELARLLNAEFALLFLLDSDQGELRLHKESLFGVFADPGDQTERISITDPEFRNTVTGSLRPFISEDVSGDDRLLPIYRPLVDSLEDLRALIDVPLEIRERGIGEVIIGSTKTSFFNNYDVQLASTAARQLAAAIERSSLYTQTDESLHRRLDQLTALARISRELSTTLDLDEIMAFIHSEALLISRADGGRLLLFDPERIMNGMPVITASLGKMPENKPSQAEHQAWLSTEPLSIPDYAHSDLAPERPDHRASLTLPLIHEFHVAGLLHLWSPTPNHFNPEIESNLQTLAGQGALALANAGLHQETVAQTAGLEMRLETLDRLLAATGELASDQNIDQSLGAIAHGLQEAGGFTAVLIGICDPAQATIRGVSGVGISEAALADLRDEQIPWQKIVDYMTETGRMSASFWVPFEFLPTDPPLLLGGWVEEPNPEEHTNGRPGWNVLLIPMYQDKETPLGLISLISPAGQPPPDLPVIESLERFGGQAAVSIASHFELKGLRAQVHSLEQASSRAMDAVQTAQDKIPVLLHKDLEQTLAIHHLNQRAQRMRAGLDIAETVNLQPDRAAVLWALGQEMLTRMNLNIALVAEQSTGGPRLIHSLGALSEEANPQALFGQRNPLRQSLQTGETLLVPNLENDPDWQNTPLLQALDAQGFVCVPIATNGQVDAAVLAISHAPLPPFSDEDEQIYNLLASQVAITLQNLNLLTETRRRLREVGLLLDFSQKLASLDPGEILRTLLESALQVIKSAHAGVVLIWDNRLAQLVPRAASGYTENQRIMEIVYRSGEALPGQVFFEGETTRVEEVDFAEQYKLPSELLLVYREATGGRLPISSLLVPMQAGEAVLGVLVLDNFNTPAAFTVEDEALVVSLSQQTALTLENARLYQASEHRSSQLRSLTAVAATITSSLQTDELIATLLEQLGAILPFDTATLWLRQGENLTVQAAQGFDEGESQLGLTVALEDSLLLSEMIASGQPINVDNVHADARFPALIEHPHLSWLGIPLISKSEVVGVIALEKTEANFYNHEQVQLATTLAGQATVALENARLFEESLRRTQDLDDRSQRLGMLNRISNELAQYLDPTDILDFTLQELGQTLKSDSLTAILIDDDGRPRIEVEHPPVEETLPKFLPNAPVFDHLKQTFGMFITEEVADKSDLEPLSEYLQARSTQSLLLLPLVTGNDLHGLIAVHATRRTRFETSEVELARTITNQAAVAFQNAWQFQEIRNLSEVLEHRVAERTEALAREHQRTQTLLRIITELSASLDLEIIINRTLVLINEIAGAEQSTVLLVRPEDPELLFRAASGYTTPPVEGGQATWLKADEGLAGWVIQSQEPALVDDLLEDERWVVKEGQESNHRSAIAVPLLVGAEALGTLMLFHREPNQFSPDLLDLIQATAKQIAVAINNAQLYLLIRDQAERLGAMLRTQQIEATQSRAILESVADGVLVTDSQKQVTLFNAAAEAIFGMEAVNLIEKPLADFTDQFGPAARTWMETIQTWSDTPESYQRGETFTEQIEFSDGQVVAVSLAPVILRNELLGTVSIFRDITHQVEVDRLKSEFVATVSHELRTPMTSIKGYVDIMLQGAAGELTEQQTRFLEVVKNNTERLNILVNDLLDVSHIEAGRVSLTIQPIDIRDIVEQVVDNIRSRAKADEKLIEFSLQLAPDLPLVLADPDQVEKILANLVDNAYNYTPVDGRVTVAVHPKVEEIQVDIQDNGIGIHPDDHDRVFERFYRGEDPMVLATAGTGLGLSIVHQMVAMHSGRLWLESSGVPGEGSTFSFTLPLYVPAEPGTDA